MKFLERVEFYHHLGVNQYEMLNYSDKLDPIVIGKRSKKGFILSAQLFWRKQYADLLEVSLFIEGKMETSYKLHGYNLMHLICILSDDTRMQETVRLLQIIDPLRVQLRSRGKLRRRIYSNPGPNFTWHIHSYEKRKPYGICINWCIHGFSSYIIWLEAFRKIVKSLQ